MDRNSAFVGLEVTLKIDGETKTAVIEKVNPKTASIHLKDDVFKVYRAPYGMLTPVEGQIKTLAAGDVAAYEPPNFFDKGTIVKARKASTEARGLVGYWVVTGNAGGKMQISRLGGGNGGRYWSVTSSSVVKVELDALLGIDA